MLYAPSYFECPYCRRTVKRGGKAEGFRKSGFQNHVYHCWELRLFAKGYIAGNYVNGERTAMTFQDVIATSPRGKTVVSNAKAALSKAKRDRRI